MEVLGVSTFFFVIVGAAVGFSAYLLRQAVERDRRYLLAVGELQLTEPIAVVEPELPAAWEPVDPVGTLALLLVYLMVLIGLWLAMFSILMSRT